MLSNLHVDELKPSGLCVQIINSRQFISGALFEKTKKKHYIKLHCLSGKHGKNSSFFPFFHLKTTAQWISFLVKRTNYVPVLNMRKDSSLQAHAQVYFQAMPIPLIKRMEITATTNPYFNFTVLCFTWISHLILTTFLQLLWS